VLVLKRLALAVVVLCVLLAVIGMLLPRQVHVERSIVIDAPRATVYSLLDGFKQFNKWSPWAALDPNAKYTREGPEFGVGAKQSWVGDPKTVGSGSQEIVELKPLELVKCRLDFGDKGLATAQFALAPESNGTKVTWSLDSDMGAGPIGRYFGLMMDRWIGADYEKGLAGLKSLAESLPKTDFAALAVALVDVAPVTVAYVEAQSSKDIKEIGATIGASYAKIGAFMKAQGLKQAGAPITINKRYDDTGYAFDAAIPVDKAPAKEVPAGSPVKVKSTYSGKALKVVMKGPYASMPKVYDQLHALMAARAYEPAGRPWDEYVSDPGTTPEVDVVTNIYQPVK
jgi:effector-binding domain-containing protein/carbon monoxide dehydrogenase subunit G